MADASQKTESASPRRLQKARKDGEFPAAREFVSAVQFFSFILLSAAYFPAWLESVQAAFRIRQAFAASLTPNDLIAILTRLSVAVLRPLAILGLAMLAITVLFQMASTNMGFSLSRLAPKFERLNAFRKLKDMPGNNMAALFQAMVMIPVMKTFDLLLEVALPVAVSSGRTSLKIKEVLKLNTGSIVELDRFVSDPVEVIVNDCVIARGEVVVVDGNYGVRINQLASREDRLRSGMAETGHKGIRL
jgi:flagellar motor switch protein FliN